MRSLLKRKNIILFPLLLLLFWLKAAFLIDPDYGWQLSAGQYFLAHGLAKTDPFSYTMPSFPWINHEWLSSILFFLVNNVGGTVLLGLVLSLLFSLIFLIFLKKYKFCNESLVFLILALSVFFPSWSIRAQIFSWIFYTLIVHLTFGIKQWQKFRIWLPLIFLFWVNLHGAFVIGLATFGLFLIYGYFQKKLTKVDVLIFIVSVLATFINPYGARIYSVVFSTAAGELFHSQINEWAPAYLWGNLCYLLLISLSCLLIWRYKKEFGFYQLTLFILLLFFGFSSIRQIPFWIIVALPLTTESFVLLRRELKNDSLKILRFQKMYYGLIILTICLFLCDCYVLSIGLERNFVLIYPDKAISYIKANPSSGNLFSLYGWGGYLDWKYPQKKVFIDGRMPEWYQQAPKGELDSAFSTYMAITTSRQDIEPVFGRFNINRVLYPNIKGDKFLKSLADKHWKKVYSDNTAVIYQHP